MPRKSWKLSCVVLFVGLAARSGQAQPPSSWSLEGRALSADTCVVGCPCLLGEPPQPLDSKIGHGHCAFVAILHVDKGKSGDVSLDGTNFGLAGEFVRPNSQTKEEFKLISYYLDSNASSEQREALK